MLPNLTRAGHTDQHVEDILSQTKPTNIMMQLNLKQLKMWFCMWQDWQKRIVICRIIENCSKTNLELLATSLEPILHLDFSTSLSPLMAALHHEVTSTFRIRRAADYPLPILPAANSTTISEPLPTTSQEQIPIIPQSYSNNDTKLISPKVSNKHILSPLQSKPSQIFLPTLPNYHTKHKPSPTSSDVIQSTISHRSNTIGSSPLHRSYNSVLDIRSSVDLLKMTKKYSTMTGRNYLHCKKRRTRSCVSIEDKRLQLHKKQHHLELYKIQLNCISQWMTDYKFGDTVTLLKEIIKMSDKGLLGYLVQCLYHRLQATRGLDGLSDKLLLKVFSYLDPMNLLKCRMVCLHWYYLVNNESLWRHHCNVLCVREGVSDIVGVIDDVHKVMIVAASWESTEGNEQSLIEIDWLQAYKDLVKLLDKIKEIVKQSAALRAKQERARKYTSAQLRSTMTLREMLESVRASSQQSNLSTQDTVQLAPESAAGRRRRLRNQKQHEPTAEKNKDEDIIRPSYKEYNNYQSIDTSHVKHYAACKLILIDCGVDRRPIVPSLPNPEGIRCLVLAGLLLQNETPRLNKSVPIPTLGRLELKDVSVQCLECDERKIITGCSDRLIRIYDIRSGRLVSTLHGHKGSVQCLQFDDNKIVSGSWDTTCIVWDIVHFTVVKVLVGHSECVTCLQFCDSTLVTGSYDHCIRIWEVTTWDCLQTIYPAHKKPITCLEFNGINIYSGSEDKTVKVWNVIDGTKKTILCHKARITTMLLSRLLLITACSNGEMYLWDLRHNMVIMQWQIAYDISSAYIVSMSIEKRMGKIFAAASDAIVYEWDIATAACVRSLQGHSTTLTSIWAGNNRIVTASEDHSVSIWYTKKASGETINGSTHYSVLPVRIISID